MNNSYDYPEAIGIVVGLIFFAFLIMISLWGSQSNPSDNPSETYCDPKTGCY